MLTNETDTITDYSLAYSVKFAVLITLEIPSILVSLSIFIYFGSNLNARVNDHNHSILILLLINFLQVLTDLPMPINFFYLNGIVHPATSAYCTWWTWYEFSLNTVNGFLMAWISFERHLLIFHSNYIRNIPFWKRRLLHIVPLVVCSSWGPLYYFFTIIISPMCTNTWYFDDLLCGLPCYLLTSWGTFDLFFDVIIPTLTIFVCNLALFMRVIYQNMIIIGRVRNNRRRERKMAFQLGTISLIYLAVWIPVSIAELGQIYINPNFLIHELDTFNFLIYLVPLILPMICLISMPEIIQKFKILIFRRQNAVVMPLNETNIRQNNTNQTSRVNATSKF